MKDTYYALHRKDLGQVFSCHAKTIRGHEAKVQRAFQNWKEAQVKGNTLTMNDYMKNRTRVKVTVEKKITVEILS